MYQLNSDSEGDEGSDINPEEEDEDSQSDEDDAAAIDEPAVHTDAEAGMDPEGAGNNLEPGPSNRATVLAAQTGARNHCSQTMTDSAGCAAHPIEVDADKSDVPNQQASVSHEMKTDKASLPGQLQSVLTDTLLEQVTDASPFTSTAAEQTLEYDALQGSVPSATAEQTMAYGAAEGSQIPVAAVQTLSYEPDDASQQVSASNDSAEVGQAIHQPDVAISAEQLQGKSNSKAAVLT